MSRSRRALVRFAVAAALGLLAPAAQARDLGPLSITDTYPHWVDGGRAIASLHTVVPDAECGYRTRCPEGIWTIVDLDGAVVTALLGSVGPGIDFGPNWQPGGTGYAAIEFGPAYRTVWLGDWRAGTREAVLVDSRYGHTLWSPDGERVAVGGPLVPAVVFDAGSHARRDLGQVGAPVGWSADGARLVLAGYVSPEEVELRIVDAASGALASSRQLTGQPESVSPDLRFAVAAHLTPAGRYRREVIDLTTGDRTPLEAGASQVAWSPDGRRLAYVGRDGGLVVRDADGVTTRLSPALDGAAPWAGFVQAPAWSPSGAHLAVVDLVGRLVVVRADGRGTAIDLGLVPRDVRWPVDPIGSLQPAQVAWSPDGVWLAFDAGFGCEAGIKAVRADGSDLRWLTNDCRIIGTAGNDRIHGTIRRDVVLAGAGDDVITTGRGHDLVFGGPGDDRIAPGKLSDQVFGGFGNDRIVSRGTGLDRIYGGPGDDTVIDAGPQPTRIYADGGPGDDRLTGQAYVDQLFGGPGEDVIVGFGKRDVLVGGDGDDLIDAADGQPDHVEGGAGYDAARVDGNDALTGIERRLAEALA